MATLIVHPPNGQRINTARPIANFATIVIVYLAGAFTNLSNIRD